MIKKTSVYMTIKKPSTVDEYIGSAAPQAREKLIELRALLQQVAPNAVESLKWGTPVFEENRILFAYKAHKAHLNFMPLHSTMKHFTDELAEYKTGKDTIQFPYDRPLPKGLIRKLATHRAKDVRENDARWM